MASKSASGSGQGQRVSVDQRQFRDAMTIVGRCVEKRNTVAILDSVKVTVNGKMEITGTDLDMAMAVSLPCAAFAGGAVRPASFLIEDPRYVSRAVAAAGGKTATFGHDDAGLSVEAGPLAIAMPSTCAIEDWPANQIEVVDQTFSAQLSADQLDQIGRVSAAISTEETRYYLNGIYFHHVADWTWRAVATNGHLLMTVDLQLPDAIFAADGSDSDPARSGVIFPRKAVRVALESLMRSKDGIALTMGGGILLNRETSTAPDRHGSQRVSMAGVVGDLGIRLSTKAIDGTFPDYRRVIPKDWPIRLVMPVATLRQAIHAVAHSYSRTPAVTLVLTKDAIAVEAAHTPKTMSAVFRCPAQHDAPGEFRIGFNGLYLLDCLKAIRGPDVAIGLTDSSAPIVISDPADTAFIAVLMPMRV